MTCRFMPSAALALLLSACSTPYQESGLLGGVSASQIDATTLRVSARGNAYTSAATISNYVLLKAAEETLARGYDLFLIIDARNASTTGFATFGQANAYASGNSAYGFGTSTTVPIFKPGEDAMVRMFKGEKPADAPPNLFAAREIVQYIGPQVMR